MRKHFLILMLMALLPLAGFAEDLSQGKMVIPSTYYGYAPTWAGTTPAATDIVVYNKVNEPLTNNTNYTVDGFFSDEACTEANKLTEAQVKAKDAGTVIYAKVTGKSTYENSLVASFEIKKMPLILSGTPGTKAYNNDATQDGTLFTFKSTTSGTTTTVDADAVKEGYGTSPANLVGTGKKFGTNPASKISFTRAKGEGVGNKALTATITDATLAKNYTIASTDIKTTETTPAQAFYSITAKAFSVDDTSTTPATVGTLVITIKDSGDDLITYTGYAQTPKYTVHDKALNVDLVENKDYTVVYKDGSNNEDAHITAGIHNIRFTGKGNYATTAIQQTFTINAAILLVKPVAMKTYNGIATLPTVPANATDNEAAWHPTSTTTPVSSHFEFQGFVDNKTAADVVFNTTDATAGTEAPAWTWNNAADATANANAENTTYALKIENEDVNKAFTLANYTFKAQKGTYTIKKKDLTANVKADALNYGEEKTFTLVDAGSTVGTDAGLTGAIAADFAALRNAIKVTKAETAETSGTNAGKYKLYAEWRTDDEITAVVNATTATAEAKAEAIEKAKTAKGNYNLSTTAGYNWLTFNAADLTIALDLSKYTLEKVYDGQPISVELDKENGLIIDGKVQETDVVDLTNLKLEVVGANTGAYQATPYVLRLSGATAKNYNIHYVAAQYTITKRPLHVTTYNQTFVKGQAYNLNQNAYYVESGVDDEGLVDDISNVFKLTTTIATSGTSATISSDAGSYNITLADVGGTASKYANYNIIMDATGVATVIDASSVSYLALDDTKDLTTVLNSIYASATDADKTDFTVTFNPRNLNVEKWNVLVLPFDVTVKDLSTAFGYAVIDVLDEANTNGNMSFKLKVSGKIDANTPFMIYPSNETNNLNQVVFTNRTIKNKTYTATVEKKDGANNKIIGTYKTTEIYGAGIWAMGGGAWSELSQYTSDNKLPIKPLRAYLDLTKSTAAHPMITIEEPDGNTTAIKVLNVETMETYSVDGWYTLNGVKLQGVPTQKGIYINNGKKVVVK